MGLRPGRWYARRMRKLALALVLLAACSGSDHHQMVVVVDAPIDTTPDAPPQQVTLQVFPTPGLISYRDGAGAWQTPTADSSGNYTLTVTADYQVVIVCHDSSGSYAEQLDAMAADGGQFIFCNGGTGATQPTTVAMTGHMVQAGSVWFGATDSSTTAPWDFTLNVSPGMHDLVATRAAHGMVLRRNQNVTTAGAIPSIDVASEGTAMTPVTMTVSGLGSDTLMTGLELLTSNEFASWLGSTATIYTPPASLLTSSDSQFVFVEAYNQTSARYADTPFTGSETTFALPAVLTGIVFGPYKASFGTLPTYDQVSLDMQQNGASLVEQSVVATKGWIDAMHATTLAFDATPPGFDPSWSINTGASYQRTFQTSYEQNNISYGSMVFDSSALQRVVNRPKFSTVARLRESIRSQHTMPRR